MRTFVTFWKKDFVNKLIVLIVLLLILSAGYILYLLANMPENSLFYTYFNSTEMPVQITATVTPSPAPTLTPLPAQVPATWTPPQPPAAEPEIPTLAVDTEVPEAPMPSETPSPSVAPSPEPVAVSTACIPNSPRTLARIVEVLDGNTIRAYFDGKVYVVRYIGIEVPGEKDVYGPAAMRKNIDLVYAKDVILIPGATDLDERGRLLRYVLVGEIFVNYELIRQGLASPDPEHPDLACVKIYQQAEEQAIAAKAGKWALSPPPTNP